MIFGHFGPILLILGQFFFFFSYNWDLLGQFLDFTIIYQHANQKEKTNDCLLREMEMDGFQTDGKTMVIS